MVMYLPVSWAAAPPVGGVRVVVQVPFPKLMKLLVGAYPPGTRAPKRRPVSPDD
jgi:hypothetical protein